MNYSRHYRLLIEKAANRPVPAYVERHHVIPRCLGGTDFPGNIALLTPEEHYVAHQLLAKIYPSVSGLTIAAIRMSRQCTGNKSYGWLRRKWSKAQKGKVVSLETRRKMAASRTGKTLTEAAKKKLSASMLGNKRAAGSIRTAEHRANLSAAMTGKKMSAEMRMKLSAVNAGKKHWVMTDEIRQKISNGLRRHYGRQA